MKRSFSVKPRNIMAAEEDNPFLEDVDEFSDNIDDLTETVDDIEDAMGEEDGPMDPEFDIRNNIEDHYIAECDKCHEIFISAMVESDSPVMSIHGECPMCHEETDQQLKWIVRPISDQSEE